eukprot:sb/3467033/
MTSYLEHKMGTDLIKEEKVQQYRIKQAMGDLEELLREGKWGHRFFGSTQNRTVVRGSDIDVLIWAEQSATETMRNLDRNKGKAFKFVKKVNKLGVLTLRHEAGIKIDFCCATEDDRKERVLWNSNLIKWYTEEKLFQITVRSIKTLFEGTPVLQASLGGVSNYAITLVTRAVLEENRIVKEAHLEERRKRNSERQNLGETSAIMTMLRFMGDSMEGMDNCTIDLRKNLGEKIERGSPQIRDPFEVKDLYRTQTDGVREIRWNIVSYYVQQLPVRRWRDVKNDVVNASKAWYELPRKTRTRTYFDVEELNDRI